MTFHRSLFTGLALLANVLGAAAGAETPDILFILDASGSMRQMTGGQTQIDAARSALESALADVPSGSRVGLRVYAHRVAQTDKDASCKDSDLSVPLAADGAEKIRSALRGVEPKGYTPIAYSLELARYDFPTASDVKKTIILLSDGEETCGGDPAAVVQKLRKDGFDVTVHVVGFNVDGKAEAQLRAVATAGNGTYFAAKDGAALSGALKSATKEAVLIKKEQAIYGKAIRGGDSFENAVPVELGVEYRLDHHQRKDEYDYFALDARAGDTLSVELKTLEKGVRLEGGGKAVDTEHPYAGFSINGPDRTRLASEHILGNRFATKNATVAATTDGKQYVLIGNQYEAMHKDFVTFTIKRTVYGDLDTDADAGETLEEASPVEARRYKANHLGGADFVDVFSFEATAGGKYQVGFIPGNGFEATVKCRIFDDYKETVAEKTFLPKEGGRMPPFEIAEGGKYYVELSLPYKEATVGQYAFELKQLPAAPVGAASSEPTP